MFFSSRESVQQPSQTEHAWLTPEAEGQMSVDLFRTEHALVIRAPMAGVAPEDLEIAIDGDLLTIRGARQLTDTINDEDWFSRECYWGRFSRSIILPVDVQQEQTQAQLTHGLLEIRIPLKQQSRRVSIRTG